MKTIFLSILFLICAYHFSRAQNPLVKMWDYRFGGLSRDALFSIQPTSDGGYILGGISRSGINGDKTENTKGTDDFWIIKTDSLGIKQWDRDYGGTEVDYLICVRQLPDGGYILGGYSSSPISGDKTQANWNPSLTSFDFWIVRIDSVGNKLWDKVYGGIENDWLYSIELTRDGGFIAAGSSESGISGNKSQACWGVRDYWIVKLDSSGNKQWDKDFGSTGYDVDCTVRETPDGYILAGTSITGISGDKTDSGWGASEYWLVKTDSMGNKQWDNDIGGTGNDILSSIQTTRDGGFILGGITGSDVGGDKTQPRWNNGLDYWIVKTDSLGNVQWDKDFGGMDYEDDFTCAMQTSDGGYIITGTSYSNIGGNKTETNLGNEQDWIVKTDSSGNLEWEKTILTPGHHENALVIELDGGCYVFGNSDDGNIGGYKSQNTRGTSDYWIIKFCDNNFLPPVANLNADSNLCSGTCIDFLNLSFNATTYEWIFSGATPASSTDENPTNICYSNPGNYDVQLIATNANGSDTLILQNYITVFPQPAPQSIMQSGDTLFANAGSSSYQWFFNGNIISGATNYFYVAPQSGDYNVVATDSNGCEVEAAISNVIAAAPPNLPIGEELTAFPNPVTTTLEIQGLKNNSADEIKIFNVFGENIFSAAPCRPDSYREPIGNCKLFPPGLYYIEITSDKKIYRMKFIKQ